MEEQPAKNKKGFFENLKPKLTFQIGLLCGFAFISVVSFFVMLALFLNQTEEGRIAGAVANSDTEVAALSPTPSTAQPENIQLAPITDQDWVRGDRDAKVSIVEYSDTECPFCKRHHPILIGLVEEYEGQVNWVYRHFPLVSLHPKAPKEAEALECAGELAGNEGFWQYVDRLFEITPGNNGLELDQLPEIAVEIGLDQVKFEECLDSGKYAQKVQDQVEQAIAAGGQGTPHNVIVAGDQMIPVSGAVPLDQLKTVIDSLL